MKRWILVSLIAAILVGVSLAQEPPAEKVGPESAKEQMSIAYAVKKRSFKKEGEEKKRILLEAIEEYRRVLTLFPEDRAGCALACFREGELHRSLQNAAEAERAFRQVLTFGDQHETVARAFLELGHLARRDKKFDRAIELYEQVYRQCPDVRDQGARAHSWIAKCNRTRKLFTEARASLRVIIEDYADDTKAVLAAYDLLALTYLDEGSTKLAAETLGECRERFVALEATGQDIYRGAVARVDGLKAWKALEKARNRKAEPSRP